MVKLKLETTETITTQGIDQILYQDSWSKRPPGWCPFGGRSTEGRLPVCGLVRLRRDKSRTGSDKHWVISAQLCRRVDDMAVPVTG